MPRSDDLFSLNLLLRSLSAEDRALIGPHLTRVPMRRKQTFVAAGERIEHVYFPEDGVCSIVSGSADTDPTEVGIFGREGVSATALLLDSDRSPHETFVQVEGSGALRIDTETYLDLVDRSATLRRVLIRYVQTVIVQTAQSAMSNAHHRIESRLARWLLMCHDRVDGDEIPLTHEFMSMMIAAQRSGVTVTLHILEGAGMIRSKRGRVVVLDRAKLEDLAGDGYGQPEAEYRRLIGPFGGEPRPPA
jgi:CRP-like cAMP-binding protein